MAQQSKGRVLCPRCDSPIWPFQRPPRLLTPAPLAPSLLGLQACSTVMSVAYCFLMDFATVPAHFHNGKKEYSPLSTVLFLSGTKIIRFLEAS